MPFDPNIPQPGTLIDADQIRTQLNALNDALTAIIAAGGITGVAVDGVSTEFPGNPTWASASLGGRSEK
jgi:hypothetical protein